MLENNTDILLLDGDCGLCHRLAIFIDANLGSEQKIKYRPIESDDSQKLIKTFPKDQQGYDTVYLYRNRKPYTRSSAAIRCLLYLKWYWKIWFPIFWLVPLPIRDFMYKLIAKFRHKMFSKPKICSFKID